jgi:sulfonate dioxygenase
MTTVEAVTWALPAFAPRSVTATGGIEAENLKEELISYRYAHLLPRLSPITYPPLTAFEHTDPGLRALGHSNPRSFLDPATAMELTPNLGTEVRGMNLAKLDSGDRDQLALEVNFSLHSWSYPYCVTHACRCQVARRGLLVFRDQQEFIDRGPDFYLEWGTHFGR